MNIEKAGYPLTVRSAFITILEKELGQVNVVSRGAILSFKDPDYSADKGGYHPVEIAISSDHRILYITDFSYVGTPPFIELAKELDFDFSLQLFQQMGRDYPLHMGRELFHHWQQNFCAYYDMGVYQVTVEPS
ncbi:MAG: DUF2787 domain-containing protein [Desulfobulbaceae bacterium]|nr:DUF2787 domain-containing protein [Desulfobulbaceae bacterium]